MTKENVKSFKNWIEAAQYLKNIIADGDLILLKGRSSDHLTRIYLNLIGEVKCQLEQCWKMTLCDHCSDLGFEWTQELEGLMAKPLNSQQRN